MGKPDQPRGPDGKWVSGGGGTLVGAVVLVLAVLAGGGATLGSGAGAGASRPGSSTSAKARDPAPVLRRLVDRGLDVDRPDVAADDNCADLVDGDGTGNVTELTRERGRHTDVRFTGEHYESARDGVTVVNAQAQPVGGGVDADELEALARSAVG